MIATAMTMVSTLNGTIKCSSAIYSSTSSASKAAVTRICTPDATESTTPLPELAEFSTKNFIKKVS